MRAPRSARLRALTMNKAKVGDYIRDGYGKTAKVVMVVDEPNPNYTFYCMDAELDVIDSRGRLVHSRLVNDSEITLENVLLESEV